MAGASTPNNPPKHEQQGHASGPTGVPAAMLTSGGDAAGMQREPGQGPVLLRATA